MFSTASSKSQHCPTVRRLSHLIRHLRHTIIMESQQCQGDPCHTRSSGSPVLTMVHLQCLRDRGILKRCQETWAFLCVCLSSKLTPLLHEMLKSMRSCFLFEHLHEAGILPFPYAQCRGIVQSVSFLENDYKNTALHPSAVTDKKS